jgi:hypothetical protein
MNSIL